METKESQIAGHEKRNSEILSTLVSKGTNLDDLRDVDFFFFFIKRQDALSLQTMTSPHLEIQSVEQTVTQKSWYVRAVGRTSLSDALSSETTRRLVELASQNNGVYDGWGASV